MSNKTLWVINGPNLNLLGSREPELYGRLTLPELEAQLAERAQSLGTDLQCFQSNQEGQLIDWLHAAKAQGVHGVILNAAGYTHTSVALRDAILAYGGPVIEVHLSNVFAREAFRHESMISAVCKGVIVGLGATGYHLALQALADV
jgi:3-dehydroquinate dehydratase II